MAKLKNTVIDGTLTVPTGTSAQRTVLEFKTSTTWTCPAGVTKIQLLVVGGGGGGGGWGGGGGGGGVLYYPSATVTPGTTYTITVGAGGTRGTTAYSGGSGSNGGNSSFAGSGFTTVTAYGGGGGGYWQGNAAGNGGSGGGGSSAGGGTGTAGQGYAGGTGGSTNGIENSYMGHGGGGGAGGPGQSYYGPNNHLGGDGGPGIACAITGEMRWYGGGGGAHTPGSSTQTIGKQALGGIGGGGNGGGYYTRIAAEDGVNGTGGGGGGSYGDPADSKCGAGGSGIVIISFNPEVVEIFSAPGSTTWTCPPDVSTVEVLVVGGGGSASGADYATGGGGGGGGGVLYSSAITVTPGATYPITVGAGGQGLQGNNGTNDGNNGGSSSALGLLALGGGRGAGYPSTAAGSGASGGGGAWNQDTGASGTSGQGYSGGNHTSGTRAGGGGGGAGGPGTTSSTAFAGEGGPGLPYNITGTTVYYGGGGGGGCSDWTDPPTNGSRRPGKGGIGGGGGGGRAIGTAGQSARGQHGVPGTGGGAGGGAHNVSSTNAKAIQAANGGSGIVIIKYKGNTGVASSNQGQLRINSSTTNPEVYTSKSGWTSLTKSTDIVGEGLFFHVDAGNRKSKVAFPSKILDDKTWTLGAGSATYFSENGVDAANQRVIDVDPWGNRSIVWEGRAQATNTGEGGWNSDFFTVDPYVPYRLSVWIRRTVIGTGSSYFGTNNVRDTSNRANNGNPYFWATGWPFQSNQWYLFVAHCFPDSRASGQTSLHPDSGIYTAEYGTYKVANISTDYILRSDAASINHRTYLYYTSSSDGRQQWIRPRIDKIDGSQPSLEDLLTDRPVDPDIWYDLKGKNHGLMYNGVTYNSNGGGSLNFNGSNQYTQTQISPTIYFPSGGTMEMWIYLTAKDRNHGFFSVVSSPKYIDFYMSSSNTMRWEVIGNTGSSYTTITSTTVFDVGRWYHVAGTFNGTTTTIYVNGVAEATQTMSNQPTEITAPIRLGEYGGYGAAQIATARIYTRPLSASEVLQNFSAQRGRFGI